MKKEQSNGNLCCIESGKKKMLVRFLACFSEFLLTLYLPSSGVQEVTECKTCERPQRPAMPHTCPPDPLLTLRPALCCFLSPLSPGNDTANKPTRRVDYPPGNKHFLAGVGGQVIYCLREIRNTIFFLRVALLCQDYGRVEKMTIFLFRNRTH